MGVFVQKVALDFGEKYVRLYIHDSKEYTEELQSKLYLEFQTSLFRFGRKNTKSHPFHSMIAQGTIHDSGQLSSYIRFLLSRGGLGKFAFARIDLLLTVPTSTLKTTKQIWISVLERIGISKITFVSTAVAGAVGAGYTFPIPTVALIVHLGQSSSEVAAVSLHECLFSTSLSLTGHRLFDEIRSRYFLQTRQELSQREWQSIESSVGSTLVAGADEKSLTTERRKKMDGITLETIHEFGSDLLTDIEIALEKLSVEELSLCSTQGILLTGELAKQEGIAQFLSRSLMIPVYSANDPQTAVIRGASELITFMQREEAR